MSAEPIDPVAVREARKHLTFAIEHFTGWHQVTADSIALLLRALDEGREASAPFAAEVDGYHNIAGGDIAVFVRIATLRRLAAFHALFSEPEEKNDVR